MQGIFRERPSLHNQNYNRKRKASYTSLPGLLIAHKLLWLGFLNS